MRNLARYGRTRHKDIEAYWSHRILRTTQKNPSASNCSKDEGTGLLFAGALTQHRLEVEAQLSGEGPRCDVVRAAERGQEVVEGDLVGDVDRRELEAHLVLVAAKDVVMSHREIEVMPGSDARRVVVVIFGSGRRDLYQT